MGAEFEFIADVRSRVGAPAGEGFLGIGDDCAVWRPTPGSDQLVTSDLLIEGVHFDPATISLHELGAKALTVNISDIAAMGGQPRHAVLGLALPGPPDAYRALVEGFVAAAEAAGVVVVGGDTCASTGGIMLSVTVMGEVPEGGAVTRSGARAGDRLFVTGSVGDSAAGLALLSSGGEGLSATAREILVARHLRPTARVREGIALGQTGAVSAMIDVSDGLSQDLGHILEESGVGAVLEADKIPLSDALCEYAEGAGLDPLEFALGGGEDYELLFAVTPEKQEMVTRMMADSGLAAIPIGRMTEAPGLRLSRDGREVALVARGYEHFKS
ncbi:MAG: thiamine-phosphate kinase [Leptospirillia bacterium]